MFQTILVATDFSKYADNAFRYGHALAKSLHSNVHVAHVIEARVVDIGSVEGIYGFGIDKEEYLKSLNEHAQKQMHQLHLKAKSLGADVTTHIRQGRAADEIAALAKEIGAGFIVIATHGRSGFNRLVLGSTYEGLVRISTVPVLAVKEPNHDGVGVDREGLRISRILCPCDFSKSSLKALPYATYLCKQFNATLVLMHVVDTWLEYSDFELYSSSEIMPNLVRVAKENLQKVASDLPGLRVETKVETGIAHRVLTDAVASQSIDLIVMSTHGHSGLPRFVLGSVAEKVVRLASCPILTIPPETKK